MAKVWPVFEVREATQGEPWAVLPFDDAIRVLELDPKDLISDLSRTPRFSDSSHDLSWAAGHRYIVVEVGEEEAKAGWKPGYYRSPLDPADAGVRLRVHQRLGEWWRDEWKKGQDADGDPAVWLWAVLKADAPDSEWAKHNRERIQAEVRSATAESRLSTWVYVRFRKEKEETAVS